MVVYALEHPRARKLAYALLERAVRLHWGVSELPEIIRGEHGKPAFSKLPGFHFNLSHSGNFAVCALSHAPVGVDIQVEASRRTALFDRVCSTAQREWLRRRGDSPQAFAKLWSMKESRCKYSGEGLKQPISAIPVPLPEDGEEWIKLDGLNFYLKSGPTWQLCLCSQEEWDGTIIWISDIDT